MMEFGMLFKKEKAKNIEDNVTVSSTRSPKREQHCPYCGQRLKAIPLKKSKCGECGKFIYVRTKQDIFPSNSLREDEAFAVDWLKKISYLGITTNDFLEQQRVLTKRFNLKARGTDVIWGLLNQQISIKRDMSSRKIIYFEMARFIYEEGKNPYELLKEASKCELLKYKESGVVSKVKINSCGDLSCKECQKLNGKTYLVEKALEEMPVPCKDCDNDKNKNGFPWCRCRWVGEL